jgi:hypothetical protein
MEQKVLSIALLFGILLLATFVMPVGATTFALAEDGHWHYEFNVGAYSYHYVYGDKVQGHGDYGTFTVHYDDITFFICDQENFDKYKNGESYSRYCVLEDVVDGDYKFRFPYADTWYRVFCNKDSIWPKDITFDLYHDSTPPDITLNLDTGATYSGIKEIRATASDVSFSVWKLSLQYYLNGWRAVKTEYNTESISYNWNTKDWDNGDLRWRVVAEDTVNNEAVKEVIVTVYNYVAPTTTIDGTTTTGGQTTTNGPPTQTDSTALVMLLGIVGIVGIVIIGIVAASRRSKESSPEMPGPDSTLKEKEITTKVLIICPFCGAKTEQGLLKCQNCGADL